jgi:hypothetical protein
MKRKSRATRFSEAVSNIGMLRERFGAVSYGMIR